MESNGNDQNVVKNKSEESYDERDSKYKSHIGRHSKKGNSRKRSRSKSNQRNSSIANNQDDSKSDIQRKKKSDAKSESNENSEQVESEKSNNSSSDEYKKRRRHNREKKESRRSIERDSSRGRYNRRDRDMDRDRDRDMDRDRDRDRRRKRRPRLNRNISSSHERSRSRERRRRRLQAECIRRAGGFKKLADMEGHETTNVFWDGFQWVAKTNNNNSNQLDPAIMNSTRKLRRLYFGNLPLHLGLTENAFQEIVWDEMKKRKFCNNENINPVLYVWFAKDKGNYGFVEFSTVEETEKALTMDGMLCKGVAIKISRPNDYSTSSVKNNQNILMNKQNVNLLAAISANIQTGLKPSINSTDTNVILPNYSNGEISLYGNKPLPPPGSPPLSVLKEMNNSNIQTKYLRVLEIVSPESINDEYYESILDDIKDGFHNQGIIINAVLINQEYSKNTPFNIGDVIIEFENTNSVENSIITMSNRKYEGKPIRMTKLDENTYNTYITPIIEKIYDRKN
ncbi:RNA-binding protein, putative [Plasmodium berghei]|uniref:RNA-binding protein, putative n=2 Tax=Plasmodium berghei TaxID=5821 RepID=A0A509ASD2_PLABA|nr:RNA-binding protein, putative [Plasmodium berghei ANKA]CXI99130.1 RNA-binding protein, putative [Plasmodium berghei]SCL97819.1 RNA-binding protein, putative [Plasmodium berghei]SCM16688.1 RNA-binding protein, putative [Plasmodium berghei]SCM18486.1 RNA-binding protein, putative [Plasmodium berghei]SCN27919.1 RNA-binding protein, putative [Plasmodium berghei]|eukprot:XP_034423571.1 RNA-binding protein, putative [Plasmodium berghei ANKA]